MGLTIPTIKKLSCKIPKDAIKACNDQIPINDEGIPKFSLNECKSIY